MASPGGSNSSTAGTSSGLNFEQSSEQQIAPMAATAINNNRNKKRRQTLLSSSSSGGCENSSGVSSGSGPAVATASTEDSSELQALMEQRRKRRKESNRESARRSRMRKQLHLDGMAAQVAGLRAENYRMLVMLERATSDFLAIESENSVLRTQAMELQARLRSLNDIVKCMHMDMNVSNVDAVGDMGNGFGAPAGSWGMGQMPLMPSLDLY